MSKIDAKKIDVLRKWIKKAAEQIDADVTIRLWNGENIPVGSNVTSDVIIAINSPDVVRRMILSPNLTTAIELYAEELIDIIGANPLDAIGHWDHIKVLTFVKSLSKIELATSLWPFLKKTDSSDSALNIDYSSRVEDKYESGRKDKDMIAHHYDVSNEFYQLFLEEEMAYSCGYFETEETSLEDAQIAKFEHICRKLDLQPGEKLLDIGCGWGGFACHAARYHDVEVHGVTLSERQLEFALAKVKKLGLEGKVKLELRDYRDLKPEEQYDKVSQIEMFEHVGLDNHDRHFQHVHGLMVPKGLYFHQASKRIAIKNLSNFRKRTKYMDFINQYIFPGGEMDYVGLTCTNMERHRILVMDTENLSYHFSLTLHHWFHRLWDRRDEAEQMVGRHLTRIWAVYLAMCCISFNRNGIQLFQLIGSKRAVGKPNRPMTRKHLYK